MDIVSIFPHPHAFTTIQVENCYARLSTLTNAPSFLAWSLSFYPQPLLNWRRRSTSGLTVDFPTLNVVGFVCYTVSTACFLFSPTIRQQYAQRHPLAPEPTVRANDFAFALHATAICVVVYSQFFHKLWHFTDVKLRRASPAALGIVWGSLLGVALTSLIVITRRTKTTAADGWNDIDVVYALSYVKLLITVVKYVPQAWSNYCAKSTIGWAIDTIILDFFGGVLSLLQLVIDSALQADWSGISGNPVKFGLSVVSLLFDLIFLVQHYVLYRGRGREKGQAAEEVAEQRPLLE
ncbi:hypothetical protein MBLNU459_g0366t2 [Dothideomycetes sp. NU459]